MSGTNDPTKARRARDPFQDAREEWLAGCNRRTELPLGCFKVLYYVGNIASVRTSGFSWFSIATIAANTGMSITAVRRALAAAVLHGLLLIVSGGAQRKPNQFWPLLNGKPLAGTLPQPAAALVAKPAVVKKERDARSGKFTSGENGAALVAKTAPHYGHFRHRTPLTESPNRSTTAKESSLPLHNEEAERKIQEHLRIASEILDQPLNPKTKALWRSGLLKLEAAGLEFMAHVVPAMREKKTRSDETGEPLEIGSLNYFRAPATKMRDRLAAMKATLPTRDRTASCGKQASPLAKRDRSKATVQSQVDRDIDRVIDLFCAGRTKPNRRWVASGLADLEEHDTDTILAALRIHIGDTPVVGCWELWRKMRRRPMRRSIAYALRRLESP